MKKGMRRSPNPSQMHYMWLLYIQNLSPDTNGHQVIMPQHQEAENPTLSLVFCSGV